MNKEKLKFLPVNAFLSLSTFGVAMFFLSFSNIAIGLQIMIAFYIYWIDAIQHSENDYLDDRLKKLEELNKELEKLNKELNKK